MKKVLCWVLMMCLFVGGGVPFVHGGDYGTAPPNPAYSSPYQGGASYGENDYYREDTYESSGPVPEGEFIIFDAAVLRPLGVVSMAFGLVGGIIAFPSMMASGSQDRVKKELFEKPYDYTFCRKLGDLDY